MINNLKQNFMTLQESLQRLDELMEKERDLLKDIQENHIHNENDKLVFYRYKNANNESIRKHILKRIEEGKTEWKSLLNDFPLPDKPFNIEDVDDEEVLVVTEDDNIIDKVFEQYYEMLKAEGIEE